MRRRPINMTIRRYTTNALMQGHFAALKKLLRYARIYGPGRTLYKVAGRLRRGIPLGWFATGTPDIGLIGCGQFAFSTIGYYLRGAGGRRIGACFDVDARARDSLANSLGVPRTCTSVEDLLAVPGLRLVYIASNHASHAPYAIKALLRGIDVYIEKPVAIAMAQLVDLLSAKRVSGRTLYAGYNRPFAPAIRDLRARMAVDQEAAFSIHCFVAGHQIGPEHWYRRSSEGTRVCGNLGHWLDLMVHILAWRDLPDRLRITVSSADPREPDDNFVVTIASDRGDLFSVMLTSRTEPFEGIYESIHLQHGETTCHIEDFRRMVIRQGARLVRRRYWPKDVGHRAAILQPFTNAVTRDWHEVEVSTLLMLHVADMVRRGQVESSYSLDEAWRRLDDDVRDACRRLVGSGVWGVRTL